MRGNRFPILTLLLVVEILERSFQGPGRIVPGHGYDLDRLLSVISTPETPNAAECQILEFREHIRKLVGHLGMVLLGYSPRQAIREGAASQVLHEDERVAEGLVCGRGEVEDLRDWHGGVFPDYLHRRDLAEHRCSVVLVEGFIGDSGDPVHIVRKCKFQDDIVESRCEMRQVDATLNMWRQVRLVLPPRLDSACL